MPIPDDQIENNPNSVWLSHLTFIALNVVFTSFFTYLNSIKILIKILV